MIRPILLAFTGASLLSIAAAATAQTVPTSTDAASSASSAKPQLGSFGIDTAGMDTTVNPGDNFYDYVNGTWNRNTEIPADRSSWGGFAILRDLSDQRTRAIIEDSARANSPAGSVQNKVGAFYASFMDEAAIEAKGAAPLKPYLDEIAAARTPSDVARLLGEGQRYGVDSPFGAGVEQDLKDNSKYSAYLGQGGLGMPDRDYYLDDSNAKYVETRAKYVAHIAAMLKLAGVPDADMRAQRVYDLEKKIATAHWTKVESRQIDKLYNPMSQAELATAMPGFDWAAFLEAAGMDGQQTLIVTTPSALTGAAKLAASEPMETWRDYLTYHRIAAAAPLLSKGFVDQDFAFNSQTLTGTPQIKDRWKRGVDLVGGGMGEAVGQLYVQRHFPPAAKAKMDELVRNLIAAMDKRLGALEWMAPETKAKARTKLAAFTPKIGYPDTWRDYSALEIVPGDALGNAMRSREFEYKRNLDKIGKPVDRGEWFMSPQTVNAYANPLLNEIVFPAAILQAPFFDLNADPAVNYGGIGAVIGHEISHHFDDQGRKFDPQGNLADWWTPQDVERFKALTDQMVAQYNGYEPLPGKTVNGELTLGENMADLAGLTIAYDAYKLSLGGKPDRVIDGLTGDQRFFLGFGQIWRQKYRDAVLLQQLTTDPHTPGFVRPEVVRNFDPWYAAFQVKNGKLYLAPDKRIKVW